MNPGGTGQATSHPIPTTTSISLTGALCLWFSVIVSLGGFGLTLRALEARVGRLSLDKYHGLYDHSPTLAACFLLTGLGSVGFPGTCETNPLTGRLRSLTFRVVRLSRK